jgi:2-polyprenyl-6-methoxyphenol hydroxylase-like FAD-dependent oxidoreductase
MTHAVIAGASMSGLLAAAALSDVYDRITILDRDVLPGGPGHRRGNAQSHHAHGLLAGGQQAMERLLPGLTAELFDRGALLGDVQEDLRWIFEGRSLARRISGVRGLLLSRPLLEDQVRRRVMDLPAVEIVGDRAVTGLTSYAGAITGVRLTSGAIDADLVIDATGRGSRTPMWLGELGYAAPKEERVRIDVSYSSRIFRREAGHLDGDLGVIIGPAPDLGRSGLALAIEDDRWIVTLSAYGDVPPAGLDDFVTWTKTLASPDLHDLVASAEPIGDARAYRTPASVRRGYHRLRRVPDGLLVTGDAVTAFNPRFGQGMTVAALEALALRDWARTGDLRPAVFFKAIARAAAPAWDMTRGNDLRIPQVEGDRTVKVRLVNAYMGRYIGAASTDPELARRFLRVSNLLDAPTTLLGPDSARRVLLSSRT